MVSKRVMIAAAVQSHHSRRSIRRKFARGSFDCANPGCFADFGLRSCKIHRAETTRSRGAESVDACVWRCFF
jgi:hypothetical protein